MAAYVITCSSTADLPFSYVLKRQLPFLSFRYSISDQEYLDDLWQSVSAKAFYQRMDGGAMPVTTQVNVAQYIEFFEPFLQQDLDVLHVEFSSGLSGSYQSALMARDELTRRYPDRQLRVLDSLSASSGYGLLVDAACDLRDSGADLQTVHDWLLSHRLTAQHWFFSTDLTHYKRGGRISASAAVIGTLLNICPLMYVNTQGKLIPHSKLRGRRNAIRAMLDRMETTAVHGLAYADKCFISHSDCLEDARQLADAVSERFPKIRGGVQIFDIGAVIGSHTGRGTVALFFFGDKRAAESKA